MHQRTNLRVVVGAWMKVVNPSRIISRRKRMGFTQTDLANLVGCTQQYISLIENGLDTDCSERIARKIAQRLDVDLEEIFQERPVFGVRGETMSKRGTKRKAAA